MSKVVLLAALAVIVTACSAPTAEAPNVASLDTPSSSAAAAPSSSAQPTGRPRHRVDESKEESTRLIQPWRTCMKNHGADVDQQPDSLAGAEQWAKDHQAARDACLPKLPLLPWGEDSANPAYKDNVHRWVQCMTAKGMHVAETPDDAESPWRLTSDNQPPDYETTEQTCEVQVMSPSDK